MSETMVERLANRLARAWANAPPITMSKYITREECDRAMARWWLNAIAEEAGKLECPVTSDYAGEGYVTGYRHALGDVVEHLLEPQR